MLTLRSEPFSQRLNLGTNLLGESDSAELCCRYDCGCMLTMMRMSVRIQACYIWPGFQSKLLGSLGLLRSETPPPPRAELSLSNVSRQFCAALARYCTPICWQLAGGHDICDSRSVSSLIQLCPLSGLTHRFLCARRQALCSLICFLLGASLGQLGDRIGPKRRLWVVGSTFFQAFLVMAASLCAYFSHEPSVAQGRDEPVYRTVLGFCVIGFASASLGLHGIVAKRMERTEFGTAVVLTTVWVELASLPTLFSPRFSKGREHRLVAVGGLFLGGLFGGALVRQIGGAGTFGVVAGVRVASALSWCVAPAKKLTRGV